MLLLVFSCLRVVVYSLNSSDWFYRRTRLNFSSWSVMHRECDKRYLASVKTYEYMFTAWPKIGEKMDIFTMIPYFRKYHCISLFTACREVNSKINLVFKWKYNKTRTIVYKSLNKINKTRNVSIGHGCPHLSTFVTILFNFQTVKQGQI